MIGRMIGELRDHLSDLAEHSPAEGSLDDLAEQCLGSPEQLADSAVENLRAGSFAARHPVWTFVALPIPLTLAGWAAMLALTVGLVRLGHYLPCMAPLVQHRPVSDWPAWLLCMVPAIELITRVIPPVLITMLLCRWSQRTLHGMRWSIFSCVMVAAIFGVFFSRLDLPLAPHTGRWSMGLALPGGWEQFLQLLIPPTVALWWICRHRARRWPTSPACCRPDGQQIDCNWPLAA
jgi:hypothetical protein